MPVFKTGAFNRSATPPGRGEPMLAARRIVAARTLTGESL
jgi:hypothetical protein